MTQLFLYFTLIISSPVSVGEANGVVLTTDVEYVSVFENQIGTISSKYAPANNDSDVLINIHPIDTVKTISYSYVKYLNSQLLLSKINTYHIRAPPLNSYLFV